jgi:glycosyltransferase involved in cell wall biosynthesis
VKEHDSRYPPKDIAIVIGQLSYGGAERQCVELATGLAETGMFRPIVFCTSRNVEPNSALLTAAGIEWLSPDEKIRVGFGKLLWLIRSLKKRGCRLVYGMLNIGNVYGGFAARISNISFVASIRTSCREPMMIRIPANMACRWAEVIIANSSSAAQSVLKESKFRRSDVQVINNAVRPIDIDPDQGRKIRHGLKIPLDAIVIGTVANLKPEKRVEFFLGACVQMDRIWMQACDHASHPLHYVWVGEGKTRRLAETIKAAIPFGLASRIHFPGESAEVAAFLAAFNIFVLTSSHEGMPNALLEAMSAGLPCVATDVAGTRDVLDKDGRVGLLANPMDSAAFAEAVINMAGDPIRMKEIGSRARRYVREKYSVSRMISEYSSSFQNVLLNGRHSKNT